MERNGLQESKNADSVLNRTANNTGSSSEKQGQETGRRKGISRKIHKFRGKN